ncbi:MAG: hypothetical protein ACI8T6_001297, partial [Candidatus Poseidoniaceae archaeon]
VSRAIPARAEKVNSRQTSKLPADNAVRFMSRHTAYSTSMLSM